MRTLIIIFTFFFLICENSLAGPRYAKETDGILLVGQSPVPLQDGLSVYLPLQDKVVSSDRLFTKKESLLLRQNAIEALRYSRYWESGSPPEEPMQDRMMRFVKNAELKRESTKRFIADLQSENWFREGLNKYEPPPEGG